ANDLFERRIVSVRRNEERADRDLGRILEIFAGQPMRPQPGTRRGLKQQRASMRLLLALAAQFDGIAGFNLYGAKRLPIDQTDQRTQKQIRQQSKCGGDSARDQLAGTGKGAYHRRAPQGGSGIEAGNVQALAEEHAGAEKADPGDDLRGNASGGLLSPAMFIEKTTNRAAPTETSALVRSPAMRCRHCRSKPMSAPNRSAMPRRKAISPGSIT